MAQGFRVRFEGPGATRRSFEERRRNRHGRGLRGNLMHPGLPGSRTRADRFEDLVTESAERLELLWGQPIASMEFTIELMPRSTSLDYSQASGRRVPLGRTWGATPRRLARVVVYRRPVEELADSPLLLPEVVHLAVVELVAELLLREPEEIDPDYHPWEGGF
ncbi:MAG: metallopeptidase family protein [Micrococcaceae bacterium]|uniref:metallopeptidase family protein n=1 Tax=Arthrobacter sp. 179 TaxID=3457734 RepID=UPI00264D2D8E|nr:metallopeptidase family protein [Micrococcaceae bacterium]MDN5812523.1 metallopeptidase family protein [Micrococcaceae bacterium]MDN5825092.1 metallopeptidase family protein [Micrococcaceae bacterium]MDN5878882.1 metallopeptidase family protein [Micrococcaceae bacterium]MDN5885659.1 metallopeptidase family protein [Micrococcaceae bacterium]